MEDVKKMIDRINKAHKRANNLWYWILGLAITDLIVLLIIVVVGLSRTSIKGHVFGALTIALMILSATKLILLLFAIKFEKQAKVCTELLHGNYLRLKLVNQSYFDLLSLLVSPAKVMFFHGSRDDDEKVIMILIMKDETIEWCEMKEEKVTAIFEPMFK